VDELLILESLKRLEPEDIAELRHYIDRRYAAKNRTDKAIHVSLVGLRGAGKSTLGRRLADRLGVPFVELNRLIEEEYGAPINEILELSGQSTYRRYERRALERVVNDYPAAIIGTGGGLVTEPSTLDYLLKHTLTVWLTASPEEHMRRVIEQGDMRPMADNTEAMDDLKRILKAREPYYRKAQLTLSTAGKTEDESLQDLLDLVTPQL
jgi:XRE family aerobic/anaerobic benzoate catabolism transcriptional regulator